MGVRTGTTVESGSVARESVYVRKKGISRTGEWKRQARGDKSGWRAGTSRKRGEGCRYG